MVQSYQHLSDDYEMVCPDAQTLDELASFFKVSPSYALERLRSYKRMEMAEAWRKYNPQTAEEIRTFYASTDLYIWELIQWHAHKDYERYWDLVRRMITDFPPSDYPNVLDYGAGTGCVALRFAEAGYKVTLADVPGKTLTFAKYRFVHRGLQHKTVEIKTDLPVVKEGYDIIVCFDVLEHVPQPEKSLFRLADRLRPGGIAAIVASFFTDEVYPHHLAENVDRFGLTGTWQLAINASGLDPIGKFLYRKVTGRRLVVRRMNFLLWQRTGWYFTRIPRSTREV